MSTSRLNITAADLRPGDVIVDGAGRRYCAAFDVDTPAAGPVVVWSAMRDQERGVPDVVHYDADEPVTVDRRDGDPVVTRQTVEITAPAPALTDDVIVAALERSTGTTRHLMTPDGVACDLAGEFAAVEFDPARVTCPACQAAPLVLGF